jgi:hypothetical protein
MKEAQIMAELACSIRLSPGRRGEDEGEGFALGTEQFRRKYPSLSPKPTPLPSPALSRPSLPLGGRRKRRPYPQLCAISCRTRSDNQRTLPSRANRSTLILSWRAKEGQHAFASSSLGVSRDAPPGPLPAGSTATRARVAKLVCNYENEQQN